MLSSAVDFGIPYPVSAFFRADAALLKPLIVPEAFLNPSLFIPGIEKTSSLCGCDGRGDENGAKDGEQQQHTFNCVRLDSGGFHD